MKNILRRILLCICICVFVYSAYQLGMIFYEYYQIEQESAVVIEKYIEIPETKEEDGPLQRKIDFQALQKENPDVVGWIYIPDTKLDEPVVQGEDNEYYLDYDIYKERKRAGTVFVDQINTNDWSDSNTILYGHNMNNGSRFGEIKKYKDETYLQEHPYIYVYLPNGCVKVYEVFSIILIDAVVHHEMYTNQIDYSTYLKSIQSNAIQYKTVSDEEAPLIMLSTCQRATGNNRYIVYGRLQQTVGGSGN